MIAAVIFWICLFLIVHTYVLYPVLLSVLSRGRKGNQEVYGPDDDLPFISVIISAYNEEDHIGEKVKSIYDSNYPPDRFEVLVGSDHSSDNTVKIVEELRTGFPSLQVFNFTERRGKGSVVNDLVNQASGRILILTDANVYFDRGTIFQLVKHFRNEKIGLVDTHMINRGMRDEGISYQEKAYISREVKIKNREGRIWGAMMGPFGGCYAIRKEDYAMVPSNFLVDDFYINMRIFEKGKLAINELKAEVFEELPDDLSVEFRRKVRIGTGNFQNLRKFWKLLVTKPYGFPFLSHKVIRWIGPMLLLVALAANIYLSFHSSFYLLLLALQLLAYLVPLADMALHRIDIHVRLFRLITHFFSMNAALFVGFFKSFGTIRSGTWERTSRK